MGASLSDAAHHHSCAIRSRWDLGCDCAHLGRAHAGVARSTRCHRKRDRRERQHRGRTGRTRGWRWLYVSFSGWSTHVANGAIFALPYDLVTDFEPIALVHTQPFLIVAKKTMPAKDLKELIVWLKANPDKASQGHPGVGNPSHV